MDSEKPLTIGYAGSLIHHDPEHPQFRNNFFRDWFWVYSHLATDPSTRSGYFLFKAIQYLKEKENISSSELQVHLWGNIEKGNNDQLKKMGIDDLVRMGGYLTKERSQEELIKCDILFLPVETGTKNGDP